MGETYGASSMRFMTAIVPFGMAILGTVLANFPVTFTSGLLPTPLFGLMATYYWGLVRPDLMPPWAAFLVGLCEDILSGGPPGVWATAYVVSYAFIERQRESLAGLGGYGAILGFAAALLVAAVTAFAIVAVYYWRLPPVGPLIAAVAVDLLWYIPALAIMNVAQRRLVGAARGEF